MCGKCINRIKNEDGNHEHILICYECKRECEVTTANYSLEGVLSRYQWWSVVLKDAKSSLQLTEQNEMRTRNMAVREFSNT
jgi:hypothetical protein